MGCRHSTTKDQGDCNGASTETIVQHNDEFVANRLALVDDSTVSEAGPAFELSVRKALQHSPYSAYRYRPPLFRGNAAHLRAAQPNTAALTRQWVDSTLPSCAASQVAVRHDQQQSSGEWPATSVESESLVPPPEPEAAAPLISFC